jgi:hypothetical protein
VGDFSRDSVQHAGSDWVRRYYALREKAEVATQPIRLGKAPKDVSIYARTNLWMINTARVEAIDSALDGLIAREDSRRSISRTAIIPGRPFGRPL